MPEGFQEYRRREAKRFHRQQQRRKLREIREKIKALRARRRSTLTEIRAGCRAERHRVSADARALREATRARLKAAIADMRAAQRGTCHVTRSQAKEQLGAELQAAAIELAGERAAQLEEKRAEQTTRERTKERTHKRSSTERRQEADDEVRHNLSPDLAVVFERVKKNIRPRPRMSRTEVFLHWAEEHPDEVLRIQAEAGERAWMAELAELEREHKRLAKAHRRRPRSDAELAEALAAVPF
jgi:hypothetical protein